MNIIKKHLGVVWIAAGLYAAYYLITVLALPKFATGNPEDKIPAIIYCFLVPIISLSLILFGEYSIQDEYQVENM